MKLRQMIAQLVAVVMVMGGSLVGLVAGPAAPAHATSVEIGGGLIAEITGPAQSESPEALRCYDGWLKSKHNGLYVSVEMTYTGVDKYMLRARKSYPPGSWERFEFCWGSGLTALHVHMRSLRNGLWVSSEQGYSGARRGMLRARASSIGPWEKFYSDRGLKSLANNRWVSVEMNYSGSLKYMLRARATSPGPWEQFENCCP
jgi:hypothetical protein